MYTYELYLAGYGTRPTYAYNTPGHLTNRLSSLAQHSALAKVDLMVVNNRSGEVTRVVVTFKRTPREWGWSAGSTGIPTYSKRHRFETIHSERNMKLHFNNTGA